LSSATYDTEYNLSQPCSRLRGDYLFTEKRARQ